MSALTRHLLQRIASDPRVAFYFDPFNRSMELLTEAHAADEGIDLEEFRKAYYASLRFERPQNPDLLAAAKAVMHGLNARIDAAADRGMVPVFDGIADLRAAIAKAEGRA